MEKGPQGEGLFFNGHPVKKGKENAEKLASDILQRGSTEDLVRDLKSQGYGTKEVTYLIDTIGARTGRTKHISSERSQAVDRLRDAHAQIKGLPKNIREPGDTFRGESGIGRLALPPKDWPGIEGTDKKRN